MSGFSLPRVAARIGVLGMLFAWTARADQNVAPIVPPASAAAPVEPIDLPANFEGPAPPMLPDTIARDASGQATIRAVRLSSPIRLDGRLDEAIYAGVHPMSDFIQTDPQPGSLSTEKTEMWVFFDREQIYVSARCWESRPDRLVAEVLQRDSTRMIQNESFTFLFDTFFDRRNGVMFMVNPLGSREEGQITNEGQFNRDWNPIWNVKVARFEGGWTVEAAVPFKSLRYGPGRAQIWGFTGRRVNRWKNEVSHLTPILNAPASSALFRISQAATLVGLETPERTLNLDIKPYAISSLSTDRTVPRPISNELSGDVGGDAKYSVTQNLTADFTYNTDFAQVEADEQQVNLTRFSLFFPEKRDFFLENQGLFGFGGAAAGTDTPILFYSRRIGVNGTREVPIDVGERLTGRVGPYNLGVLNIQTGDEPVSGAAPTNFSVVRLKRDLLRKSSVGLLLTRRSVAQRSIGANTAYGVDGTFAFFSNLAVNTYWARTDTEGLIDDDTSYRAQLDYNGDRYGVQAERLVVGGHFNPEVGFVRRSDMRRTFGRLRFSPRPRFKSIRKFSWAGALGYVENGTGHVETRDWDGEFLIDFQNSDRFLLGYSDTYEFVPAPFRFASGVTIAIGGYHYSSMRSGFNFGQQRRVAGNVQAEYGTFYDGHKTAIDISQGRVNLSAQLSIEPTFSVNWVDLPDASFTSERVGPRVTYTVTPLMFASALVQYSSDTHAMNANVRLRWEYRPGSELFVVYNEQRDTLAPRFPALSTRALIVKINYLLRF